MSSCGLKPSSVGLCFGFIGLPSRVVTSSPRLRILLLPFFFVPGTVIFLPELGVPKDVVGLSDLLKPLLTGIRFSALRIRMMQFSQLVELLLELIGCGIRVQASPERGVVIPADVKFFGEAPEGNLRSTKILIASEKH